MSDFEALCYREDADLFLGWEPDYVDNDLEGDPTGAGAGPAEDPPRQGTLVPGSASSSEVTA